MQVNEQNRDKPFASYGDWQNAHHSIMYSRHPRTAPHLWVGEKDKSQQRGKGTLEEIEQGRKLKKKVTETECDFN